MSELVDKNDSIDKAKYCDCSDGRVEELGSGELVCTSCGSVRDMVKLTDGNDCGGSKFLSSENRAFSFACRPSANLFINDDTKKRLSEGKLASIEILHNLVSACNMDHQMAVRSRKLLDSIFGRYRKNNSDFRLLLVASCVYRVLLEEKKPIVLAEFCKHIGKKQQIFLSVYHKMCKKLGLKAAIPSTEDQVMLTLENLPCKTSEEKQRKQEIVRKTIAILNLGENYWLKHSYTRRNCVLASAYFAWRLSDLSNKNCCFESFFYLYDFEANRARVEDRVRDLYKLFIKLGKHIPYIKKSLITKKYIVFFLKDILECSEYLLGCVKAEETKKELEEAANNREQTVEVDHIETDSFDYSIPDEQLISESEWDLYIRSEEEVANIKLQLKNKGRARGAFM